MIGGGVAGVQAAIAAKKACPSKSVAIVSNEPAIYSRPALRSVITGYVKRISDIAIYSSKILEQLQIMFLKGHEALNVIPDRRTVITKNKHEFSIKYDKLVFTTGSVPAFPQTKSSRSGLFTIKWFNDALELSRYSTPKMKAFVDGAGFIGLEVAEALARRGLDVTIVVRSRLLRKLLEPDLSQVVARRIDAHDVKLVTGATIEEVGGKQKVEYVLFGGQKLSADIVVFTRGVKPNASLAVQTDLQLAQNGAIKTGNRMQTSSEGVYAAGDCAETLDFMAERHVYRPLSSIAAWAAEIAGSNAAGAEKTYNGFVRQQYNKIFGSEVVSIGLSTEEAHELGIAAEAVDVKIKEPRYRPLSQLTPVKALMKAVVQKGTEILLGWQVVGLRQCSWASYLFQELIRNRQNLSDVQELGINVK